MGSILRRSQILVKVKFYFLNNFFWKPRETDIADIKNRSQINLEAFPNYVAITVRVVSKRTGPLASNWKKKHEWNSEKIVGMIFGI